MKKYRFVVHYQTPYLKKLSQMMRDLDLGNIQQCIEEVITFDYEGEDRPISYFKELFKQCFEASEQELVHIEGGPVE